MDTIINLQESSYAHDFSGSELIHKDEFDRVMGLIRQQLKDIDSREIKEWKNPVHRYNTISVLGERGTGKTSFLCSVLKEIEDKEKDIEVLNIIDPTMIEEKEHIFLLVVSLINEAVKRELTNGECRLGTKAFQQRNMWNLKLQKLAKGLPTLKNVGVDHNTREWQSHEFIMERGLDTVSSAFSMVSDFHQLVKYALEILDKKAFLLMLDDIDVDMQKGWDVLEMLRKYVTTPQIITLLSGNLKLYSLNVRKHQWKQLEDLDKYEQKKEHSQIVNELEGQYLLKVLKPENRIHLNSIKESIESKDQSYIIRGFDDKDETIKDVYYSILNGVGIKGAGMRNVFTDYLLSLSVRTQIQFVKSNKEPRNATERIEAFLTRLYASNINANTAAANAQMLNIVIQRYIESQRSTPEIYLLTPTSNDDDINACLTALSIMFIEEAKQHPFLLFDYYMRMGYMRNVRLGLSDNVADNFYNRTGLAQQMSLKNNVGLSLSYSYRFDALMAAHTALPGLAEKDKQSEEKKKGRIDYEVENNGNHAQRVLAYFPLSKLRFTSNGKTKMYYSFFSLIASLSDIMRHIREGADVEVVKAEIQNQQVLRSYPVWSQESRLALRNITVDNGEQDDIEEAGDNKDADDTLDMLANNIMAWAKEYKEPTPPYLLGKIATRTFTTIQKISQANLGEQMHREIVAFLNACLIEELREHYVMGKDMESIESLNAANAVTKNDNFLSKIDFVLRNKALDSIKFTTWMIKCPLIWCFMEKGTLDGKCIIYGKGDELRKEYPFETGYDEKLNVYHLLEKVVIKESKDENKPTFSGSVKDLPITVKALKDAGLDPKAYAEDKRDASIIAEELHKKSIFKQRPYKSSVEAYRTNYSKVFPETEAATAPKKRPEKTASTKE